MGGGAQLVPGEHRSASPQCRYRSSPRAYDSGYRRKRYRRRHVQCDTGIVNKVPVIARHDDRLHMVTRCVVPVALVVPVSAKRRLSSTVVTGILLAASSKSPTTSGRSRSTRRSTISNIASVAALVTLASRLLSAAPARFDIVACRPQ